MKPCCSLAQPVAFVFLDRYHVRPLPHPTWGAAPAANRRTTAESILGKWVVQLQDTPIEPYWLMMIWDYTFFVLLNISGIIVSHILKLLILIHADLVICWNTIWVTLCYIVILFFEISIFHHCVSFLWETPSQNQPTGACLTNHDTHSWGSRSPPDRSAAPAPRSTLVSVANFWDSGGIQSSSVYNATACTYRHIYIYAHRYIDIDI